MPSLRQKVTTYFRQLSFIAEPKENTDPSPRKLNNGNFITKYLEGQNVNNNPPPPDVYSGRDPNDLPDYKIGIYPIGTKSVTCALSGPNEGITAIKRSTPHLTVGSDIDFIDNNHEQDQDNPATITKEKTISQKYQNELKFSGRNRKYSCENVPNNLIKPETKLINEVNASQNSSQINNEDENQNKDLISAIETNTNYQPVNLEDNSPISPISNVDLSNLPTSPSSDTIAGISNWKMDSDHAYGLSSSLYERNCITNKYIGNPIADCFGIIVHEDSAILALADGVNWGDKARLAARCSVLGSLEYLNTAIFGSSQNNQNMSTRDIFVSLLRSFWKAHDCILELGGALSTLTVIVVLPLLENDTRKYVACGCNVGDSLAYVYSKKYGVRELTKGSHDITSMRDMRDALGALGPVDGNKPELSNLTLSMTTVEPDDIVFVTSDGISDNFDPVVGKFADAFGIEKSTEGSQLASKRQNKSTSSIMGTFSSSSRFNHTLTQTRSREMSRPTHTMLPNNQHLNTKHGIERPKLLRSHTVINPRKTTTSTSNLLRSPAGLPLVSGIQRHALTLLRLEDLLSYGIDGRYRPCTTARKCCQIIMDFAKMITVARRKVLEQNDLFYKTTKTLDGSIKKVQLTFAQHKAARRRVIESTMFMSLPGKLDHATIVAFTVGSGLQQTKEFTETDF